MMCFRDMTFCNSDCVNSKCPRHFGDEERTKAIEWWGNDKAPVAFSDFSNNCKEYINKEIQK